MLGRWRAGAGPDDLRERHPFLTVGDRYRPEDAAAVVEIAWFFLVERHRASLQLSERALRPVVEAAARHPLLGRLLPFRSTVVLHFSQCTRYPYTSGLPAIRPSSPLGCGSFQVTVPRSYISGDLGAEDAIDEVVSRLPAGCGPAIQGTAHDVGRTGAGARGRPGADVTDTVPAPASPSAEKQPSDGHDDLRLEH